MSVRLVLFIQALIFFILGIYLSSLGLPSEEVSLTAYAGGEIMDALDDTSDNPEVHKIAEKTKSSLALAGVFMFIFSVLELIGLGVSLFV